MYINFGGTSRTPNVTSTPNITSRVIQMSHWHQETYTYDRVFDRVSFYLDGVLIGHAASSGAKGSNTGYSNAPHDKGWFGATSDGLGIEWLSFGYRPLNVRFNGLFDLDDFAVYDRALSALEIQQKYAEVTAFNATEEDGLSLYYSFDNVTGDTALNSAPSTKGSYDLLLGYDSANVVSLGTDGSSSMCVSTLTKPILVCHSGEACGSGITNGAGGGKKPNATHLNPAICAERGSVDIVLDSYGYDLDGDRISAFVTSLPQHGTLKLKSTPNISSVVLFTDATLPMEVPGLYTYVEYANKPTDPYNVSETDSFGVKFFDGQYLSDEVRSRT